MVEIEADKAGNLLTFDFSGRVTPEEMKVAGKRVKELLAGMKPGFRLLSDLSGLESMDPACVPYIRENMDLFNERKIAVAVRVIPDPRKDIGLNILSLFHYDRGVRIVTCETVEEARAALAD